VSGTWWGEEIPVTFIGEPVEIREDALQSDHPILIREGRGEKAGMPVQVISVPQ
jgi:hypothetical protein